MGWSRPAPGGCHHGGDVGHLRPNTVLGVVSQVRDSRHRQDLWRSWLHKFKQSTYYKADSPLFNCEGWSLDVYYRAQATRLLWYAAWLA
jgi:hypothetical protein